MSQTDRQTEVVSKESVFSLLLRKDILQLWVANKVTAFQSFVIGHFFALHYSVGKVTETCADSPMLSDVHTQRTFYKARHYETITKTLSRNNEQNKSALSFVCVFVYFFQMHFQISFHPILRVPQRNKRHMQCTSSYCHLYGRAG